MSAAKPGGSGLSLNRPAGVFTDPDGGMSRPPRFDLGIRPMHSTPQRKKPVTSPFVLGPFPARRSRPFGPRKSVRILGRQALHPQPPQPAEWSIRNPFGSDRRDSKHTRAEQVES